MSEIPEGTLSAEHDVATKLWGEEWRMPTEGEFMELFLYCKKEWTTEGGISGYRFTSSTTGNSIFFPAAGYKSDASTKDYGNAGQYWTRTAWTSNDNAQSRLWASCFDFYKNDNPQISGTSRHMGLQIRPVKINK